MTVCLDTSVFLRMFGRRQPFYRILRALLDGWIILAVSTEILLEYEEITVQLSGSERWRHVRRFCNCWPNFTATSARLSHITASAWSWLIQTTTNSATARLRLRPIL